MPHTHSLPRIQNMLCSVNCTYVVEKHYNHENRSACEAKPNEEYDHEQWRAQTVGCSAYKLTALKCTQYSK